MGVTNAMEFTRPRHPREVDASALTLLVIDLQVAYLDAGPLAEHRDRLTQRANALIRWAEERGSRAVLARTEHRRDRSSWTLNMCEDDQGFAFTGDADAQFVPELELGGTEELVKTRDSAFVRTDLAERLGRWGTEVLVVCGVSTHTCVAATVAEAYARDLEVFLVEDAIASHRPQWHEPAMEWLQEEYRLSTMSTAAIVE